MAGCHVNGPRKGTDLSVPRLGNRPFPTGFSRRVREPSLAVSLPAWAGRRTPLFSTTLWVLAYKPYIFQLLRGISLASENIYLCFHQLRGIYLHFQEVRPPAFIVQSAAANCFDFNALIFHPFRICDGPTVDNLVSFQQHRRIERIARTYRLRRLRVPSAATVSTFLWCRAMARNRMAATLGFEGACLGLSRPPNYAELLPNLILSALANVMSRT